MTHFTHYQLVILYIQYLKKISKFRIYSFLTWEGGGRNISLINSGFTPFSWKGKGKISLINSGFTPFFEKERWEYLSLFQGIQTKSDK